MNIIIIVHSSTGNTRKFADRIAAKLEKDGHAVSSVQLETDVEITTGSVRRCKEFKITNLPDVQKYDAVLLGGPVWGFSASPIMIACINELTDLKGKKVLPFVTMGFPFKFMGGKQAIGLMSSTAGNKAATVLTGFIVSRLFHNVEKNMDTAADAITALLRN